MTDSRLPHSLINEQDSTKNKDNSRGCSCWLKISYREPKSQLKILLWMLLRGRVLYHLLLCEGMTMRIRTKTQNNCKPFFPLPCVNNVLSSRFNLHVLPFIHIIRVNASRFIKRKKLTCSYDCALYYELAAPAIGKKKFPRFEVADSLILTHKVHRNTHTTHAAH